MVSVAASPGDDRSCPTVRSSSGHGPRAQRPVAPSTVEALSRRLPRPPSPMVWKRQRALSLSPVGSDYWGAVGGELVQLLRPTSPTPLIPNFLLTPSPVPSRICAAIITTFPFPGICILVNHPSPS